MSIHFTKNILNRLINGQVLTSIEDTDDVWNLVCYIEEEDSNVYQCKRMFSLFKTVYKNGKITYNDVDRIFCIDIDNENIRYHSNLVDKIINEMFPIKFPYFPSTKAYKVYCKDFLTDKKNGDFDTVCIDHMIDPEGTRININRYFKCDDGIDEDFVEIDWDTWMLRKSQRIDTEKGE